MSAKHTYRHRLIQKSTTNCSLRPCNDRESGRHRLGDAVLASLGPNALTAVFKAQRCRLASLESPKRPVVQCSHCRACNLPPIINKLFFSSEHATHFFNLSAQAAFCRAHSLVVKTAINHHSTSMPSARRSTQLSKNQVDFVRCPFSGKATPLITKL